MEFVWFIVIGLVAGWLAGLLVKGGGFGIFVDIIVGVLGALLGGFLFRSLGASGWRLDRLHCRGDYRRGNFHFHTASDQTGVGPELSFNRSLAYGPFRRNR